MKPELMREAIGLARQGRALASPNPMVGAVLERGGEVVGRGFHTWDGQRHAELAALEEAGERARGATLYVNLEPCSHAGRTPPCVDALIAAGVARVVAPIEDPNPLVSGGGFRKLREAGVDVALFPEFAAEAEKLNEPFLHFMRTGRPLVTLKTAITLDGKISAPDDCLLNDRTGLPRRRPLLRIVMDSQLRMPMESKMARSAADDLLLVTTSASSAERRRAAAERGARVLVFNGPGGRADLHAVVDWLARERYLSLLIEAGSKMNWTALESGLVDRIFFYYGPKILGGLEALPLAGGIGRRRRADAIRVHRIAIHSIPPDEFAVEGYLDVHGNR